MGTKLHLDSSASKAEDAVVVKLTGAQTIAGVKTFSSPPIVPTPVGSTDAVNKAYADAVATGLDVKLAVRAATTANITLSGAQTIDGVAVIAGDRVLVKDQNTGSQNGIYVAAAGAWSRATDADASAEVTTGMFALVTEGTVNGAKGFVLITPGTITLGSTILTFTQFNQAAPPALTVQEEGVSLATAATVLNFVGDGVAAAGTGGTKTITITGGGMSNAERTALWLAGLVPEPGYDTVVDVTPATLVAADDAAVPGTFLRMSIAGNYPTLVTSNDGTAEKPIILAPPKLTDKGRSITGNSNYSGGAYALINEADYRVFAAFEVQQHGKGVQIRESISSVLKMVHIHDIGEEAFNVAYDSIDTLVEDVFVDMTGRRSGNRRFGEAFYIGSFNGAWVAFGGASYIDRTSGTILRRCRTGPNVTSESVDVKEGTQNTLIEDCSFNGANVDLSNAEDAGQGFAPIKLSGEATEVRNTVTRGGGRFAVWLIEESSGSGSRAEAPYCKNNEIHHNEWYGPLDLAGLKYGVYAGGSDPSGTAARNRVFSSNIVDSAFSSGQYNFAMEL